MSDVEGYLLDTNVISALVQPGHVRHAFVEERLKAASPGPILLPVIAIAEIEFGMAKAVDPDFRQQADMRSFFAKYPLHLAVDDGTVEPYALLRAQVWRMYATPRRRGHAERRPEELKDRLTGKELGIDERDLLIAAVAAQYNLVLATLDDNEGMKRIEAAGNELARVGGPVRLRISYWV